MGLHFSLGDLLAVGAAGSWSPEISGGFVGPDGGGICGVGSIEPVTRQSCQSLAGRIGTGSWFKIGSSWRQNVAAGGRLFMGFADTDPGNHLGSVTAKVSGGTLDDPEPGSAALVLATGNAWALSRRRRGALPV